MSRTCLLEVRDPGVLFGDLIAWREGRLAGDIPMTSFRCVGDYWRAVDQDLKDSGNASLLPRLAIAILSFAVNTATCERLFSELGLIDTAMRNQMCSKKALQIHAIRKHGRDKAKQNPLRQTEPINHVKRIIDAREKSVMHLHFQLLLICAEGISCKR
jgi:hypothetical protein